MLMFFSLFLSALMPILLSSASTTVSVGGIGIGTIIAIVASWSRNKSVLWAIIHGIFGWFYVIYYVITR
ncbi:MAG: hypothetical protein J5I52_10270 [Saprospiraceae bacterium]|nr:MAG: hypothetical protein UZ09_BCD002001465 [Bacteroidetes bacterium OLB9]MCO6464519.1 hypothetical protein [Saprospiraceae bacterium]MCZ2339022.1 hypothetical protein [Chitinophagales bacterium]